MCMCEWSPYKHNYGLPALQGFFLVPVPAHGLKIMYSRNISQEDQLVINNIILFGELRFTGTSTLCRTVKQNSGMVE